MDLTKLLDRYLSREKPHPQGEAPKMPESPVLEEFRETVHEVFVLCKVDYSALGPHTDWVQAQAEAVLGDYGIEQDYHYVGYTHQWYAGFDVPYQLPSNTDYVVAVLRRRRFPFMARVKVSHLNVRMKPGVENAVMKVLDLGDEVEVIAQKRVDDSTWYCLGPFLWVKSSLVEVASVG